MTTHSVLLEIGVRRIVHHFPARRKMVNDTSDPNFQEDGMGRHRIALFVAVLLVAVLGVVYGYRSDKKIQDQKTASTFPSPPEYVGAERCAGGHAQAAEAWRS